MRAYLSALLLTLLLATPALAKEYVPVALQQITVQEHLGGAVDRSLRFTDHEGVEQSLGELMGGDKPVLLTLNYYRCKMLCSVQLNGLLTALRGMGFKAGGDFRIVTVSIDPREGPEVASEKRQSYLTELGNANMDWTFATGDKASIDALADSLGYTYEYDEVQDQFAHTAAIFFLTPTGTISRYLYGLTYVSRDVRMALVEAGEGRIGSAVDRVLLSCFHYDSSVGNYVPFAFGVMRAGGLVIVSTLSLFLGFMWRIERRRKVEVES